MFSELGGGVEKLDDAYAPIPRKIQVVFDFTEYSTKHGRIRADKGLES
jgi:hypothetical protein